MKTVEIRDDAWGIVAFRMQIPDDWNFEGVLLRDPTCGMVPSLAYRVSSRDGLTGYQTLPSFGWHWSDDPTNLKIYRQAHCKTMEPMSPTDFLNYVLPIIRPDPVIGAIEPTVDAATIDENIAAYNARLAQSHMPGGETGGGVHSRVQYKLHGHPVEENIRVVVSTFQSKIGYYGGPVHYAWNSMAEVSGLRAPKGEFDEVAKKLYPIIGAGKYTDEWLQRLQRKMADDNTRAMDMIRKQGQATAAMFKRSHDEYMAQSKASFEHSQQVDRDRQDAMHRSAVAWMLYAGDEQLVKNPTTGAMSRVTTTAGTHGYQDQSSGDIVMSTDPTFDPTYYLRGSWTQLENVNPLAP